jgi:hypothetical protein
LKITEVAQLLGLFFQGENKVFIFTKNGIFYILGDFFKDSSGHPVRITRKICGEVED